jgi:hypothetical protein
MAALQIPKPHIALYAGGMGAPSMNFHKKAMVDRGYGEAAERIRERLALWRDSGITTLMVRMNTPDVLEHVAKVALA